MLSHTSLSVSLVLPVDWLPWSPEPGQPPRGQPKTYSDCRILKALVMMIMRRLYASYALLTFLACTHAVDLPRTRRRGGQYALAIE